MTAQYNRALKFIVGDPAGKGIELSALRVSFKIQHFDTQTPKSLSARIYNLSKQTIASFPKEGGQVLLAAGYYGTKPLAPGGANDSTYNTDPGLNNSGYPVGVIFRGKITQVRVGRESQTDTYLDVFAADGDDAYNQATVNHTLAAGASADEVRDKILESFGTYGFTKGNAPSLADAAILPRGQVFYGMARDHMRVLARDNACTWGFDDGRVDMTPHAAALPGDAVVLTAATGMIGLPQQTEDGIAVRCLLNPQLRKGGQVRISNASIQRARYSQNAASGNTHGEVLPGIDSSTKDDGFYKIIWIDYVGDTRGQDWYCDLMCLTADGSGFIPQSVANTGGF